MDPSIENPEPLATSFQEFHLAPEVLRAVEDVGYEAPSPIQAESIPPLLAGRDLVGQAQTGTGKTAAFALPLLSKLDPAVRKTQILVLAPTRELAIQVAEAFQTYARHIKDFHILPVYGGQGMETQLRGLKRGVHVVVGTPGRIMDHLRRKTLSLDDLRALVLDEADEMLKMGFIDDVQWILEHTPATRQIALFSATLPEPIRRIARQHLSDPVEIKIKTRTTTVETITQRYWAVAGVHKLDAMTRILEVEEFDGMIIFVRTKNATTELAEKLEARGYSCSALNGDMNQNLREKTIERLKNKTLDIVVATDVAARGLDVERISHVVNYDIPYDTEAYVHRIGRTGRAGRAGHAILFVAPRETRMLRAIERATKQPITQMQLPTRQDVTERRVAQFKQQLDETLAESGELEYFETLIQDYCTEKGGLPPERAAAALAYLLQRERPLRAVPKADRDQDRPGKSKSTERERFTKSKSYERPAGAERPERFDRSERPARRERPERPERMEHSGSGRRREAPDDVEMGRFRIEVGRTHGVEPKHIVGAIANEAGLDSRYIGEIKLYESHSTVSLPSDIPAEILKLLKKVRVVGQKLDIHPARMIDDISSDPTARERVPKDRIHKDWNPKDRVPGERKPQERFSKDRGPKDRKPADRKPASRKPFAKSSRPVAGKSKAGKPPVKKITLKNRSRKPQV